MSLQQKLKFQEKKKVANDSCDGKIFNYDNSKETWKSRTKRLIPLLQIFPETNSYHYKTGVCKKTPKNPMQCPSRGNDVAI